MNPDLDMISDDELDAMMSGAPLPVKPSPAVEPKAASKVEPSLDMVVAAFRDVIVWRRAFYSVRFKAHNVEMPANYAAPKCSCCQNSGQDKCPEHGREAFGFDFAILKPATMEKTRANVERYARKAARCTNKDVPRMICSEALPYPVLYRDERTGKYIVEYEERYAVALAGGLPTMGDGWNLLGRIDHEKGGNVVASARGKQMPSNARNHDGKCDHCHTKRNRQSTYGLQHANGRIKYVGRNCLADFIRDSSVDVLMAADWMTEGLSDDDSDECGSWGGGSHRYVPLHYFLVCAARAIRERGRYVKTTRDEESTDTTPSTVVDALDCHPGSSRPYRKPGIFVTPHNHTEADYDAATAVLDFVARLDGASDYENNLKVIFASETLDTRKHAGFAASAYASLRRAQMQHEEKANKAARKESQHVGTVGERLTLTMTIKATPSWDSDYGTQYANIMEDDNGNTFVWKSGKCAGEKGERVTGKCTVKKHEERDGRKQTIITRCNLEVVPTIPTA